MNRRVLRILLLAPLVAACTTDVPEVPPGFTLSASAADTSGSNQVSRCSLFGQFPVASYDHLPASFTMDLRVSRDLLAHGGIAAFRDTLLPAVPVTTSAPDSTHLALHFGPPIGDSLVALTPPRLSGGVLGGWHCSPNFPLAGDSLLDAHGYAILPAPAGAWALTPNLITH
jgi:hypothetical protein